MLVEIGLIKWGVNFKFLVKPNSTNTQNLQFLPLRLYRRRQSYLRQLHEMTSGGFEALKRLTAITLWG